MKFVIQVIEEVWNRVAALVLTRLIIYNNLYQIRILSAAVGRVCLHARQPLICI